MENKAVTTSPAQIIKEMMKILMNSSSNSKGNVTIDKWTSQETLPKIWRTTLRTKIANLQSNYEKFDNVYC